nr:MAG TPA: protein of unknown function (DUF5429) [Caudoviricetes sp.]
MYLQKTSIFFLSLENQAYQGLMVCLIVFELS